MPAAADARLFPRRKPRGRALLALSRRPLRRARRAAALVPARSVRDESAVALSRLCRTRRHHQFLLPARRLASGGVGGARAKRSGLPASASPTATRSRASCAPMSQAEGEAGLRLVASARAWSSPTARPTSSPIRRIAPPGAGSRVCSRSASCAPRKAIACSACDDLLRIDRRAQPRSSCRRPASIAPPCGCRLLRTLKEHRVAATRSGLRATMLYRGDDARRLARLTESPREHACR